MIFRQAKLRSRGGRSRPPLFPDPPQKFRDRLIQIPLQGDGKSPLFGCVGNSLVKNNWPYSHYFLPVCVQLGCDRNKIPCIFRASREFGLQRRVRSTTLQAS